MIEELTKEIILENYENLFYLVDKHQPWDDEPPKYIDFERKNIENFAKDYPEIRFFYRKRIVREEFKTFDAEVAKTVSEEFVESDTGNYTILAKDGKTIRAKRVESESYKWIKPKDSLEYQNWTSRAGYIYEEKPVAFKGGSSNLPGLTGKMPKSIEVRRYIEEENYFCIIPNIETLNKFLKLFTEFQLDEGGYRFGYYDELKEIELPMKAIII